jgi:hypothetical protein
MLKKISLISFLLFITTSVVHAELSTNPWLEQNDEEDLKEVYSKRRKHLHGSVTSYAPEEETVIDRSHAYIELPEQTQKQEDTGFLDKILGNDDKESDSPLIPNTAANRKNVQALNNQKILSAQPSEHNSDGSILSNFGITASINKLKKSIKLPTSTGLIQKFERSSGIDLKAIGRKMRR